MALVSPIDLGPNGRAALKQELPGAVFDSGRSTIAVPVPEEPAERWRISNMPAC